MAAAEFYATGTRPDQQHRPSAAYLAPPTAPQRANSHPNVNFGSQQFSQSPPFPSPGHRPNQPQYPPPPAYEEPKPNVHFAPTSHPQRSSFSGQRPPPQYLQPPPQQYGPPAPYNPQAYVNHQPRLPAPHMRPYMHQNYSESALGGYSSDPEQRRRRRKHHDKHHDKTRNRRISESSRSTATDGFLGAAGGGLIGDLIFPGLGTVGGALAGWIGGKDYGEHRKYKEYKRDREEEDWERKWSGERERSRGSHHSGDERRRSHDDRRHSHDRRRADY